jgi:hypothetical protein
MRSLLLVLLCLTPACRHRADLAPSESWRTAEVTLVVVNHNWNDIRIYLLHDGIEERVGLVSAASNATFFLPGRDFASGGGFQLRASPLADPVGFTSEPLVIQPNQILTWTLETQLPRSSIMIR